MPLLNTSPWNASVYGVSGDTNEVIIGDLIVFGDFSLADNENIICTDLKESMADRDIDMTSVPLANGMHINSLYERAKIIKSTHFINQIDNVALESFIDLLKYKLATREGYLYITRNGETRRYFATLRNTAGILDDRHPYDINVSPLVLEWICHEGFGEDIIYSSGARSVTVSPETQIVNNMGTADAKPTVIIAFNSATSVTVLKIGNDTTGEEIQYTGSLIAGDTIVFNAETLQVTLNGTPVTFEGSMLSLAKGFNTIRYTITGSSFNVSATVQWKRRFR